MTTVMVVDDDANIRKMVGLLLVKEGYDVVEADSGGMCVDKLKSSEHPDLILLDVMMPKMDGWETCKIIKNDDKTKDITIVMLTVKDLDDDKIKSLESSNADWHISKPIVKDIFLKTIKWVLDSKN